MPSVAALRIGMVGGRRSESLSADVGPQHVAARAATRRNALLAGHGKVGRHVG